MSETDAYTGDFEEIDKIDQMQKDTKEERLADLDWERHRAFVESYKLLRKTLDEWVWDGNKVLDLGSGNGAVEVSLGTSRKNCEVTCVDTDEKALEMIASRRLSRLKIKTVIDDANHFLNMVDEKFDNVVLSHSLHEISDPDDQEVYLDGFFKKVKRIIPATGCVIIDDYYYPDSVSDEEYMKFQEELVGHADERNKFINPELLKRKAKENGFSILDSSDVRTIPEIDRRAYSIVFC
jgi:SAM-dependent methyltransferase